MSVKIMTVTLKSDGKEIATLDVARGCDPVLIGRSHACGLRTPSDDNSVSGRHARLFWKGSSLYIEDVGSRNGVIFNGKRIEKAIKVEVDGLYAIGNCILVVSNAQKGSSSNSARYHRIEFLNGDNVHKLVDIKPKPDSKDGAFTIGLDPSSDICLPDMLVSRRHAQLTVRPNGDCWITDEGSRNGTYVNGEKLGAKERLLRDGDKISIAYFDMRFLDCNMPHTQSYLWAKLGVMLVTLIVIVTAWIIYRYSIQPSAANFRTLAMRSAEKENFAAAIAYLDEAQKARGTSADKLQNDSIRSRVLRWRDTFEGWRSVQSELEKGRIPAAREKLSVLVGEADAWTWNDSSAPQFRREAEFANQLMRMCSDTAIVLKRSETDVGVKEMVKERIGVVEAYMRDNRQRIAKISYLVPSARLLESLKAKLDTTSRGIARIDAAIGGVSDSDPDFKTAAKALRSVAEDNALSSSIRNYAHRLLPTCESFLATQQFLEEEKVKVSDMDFDSINKARSKLPLPDQNECARLEKFSDARNAFQKRHEAYLREANILGPMVRNLEAAGIRNGERGHLLTFVSNPATWEKALSFDCFRSRFPLSSRVDPTGVYDELFGIEYTYENLRELPSPPGRKTAVLMNFVPKCQTVKAAFEQVRTFLVFMDRPESKDFRTGKLGRLYTLGAQILSDREKLVAMLKKRTKGGTSERAKIVAGYYAEYFSAEPSYADLRSLEMQFRKLQKQIHELNERYEAEPDPEKRLKLRKEILDKGIPGMEAVRARWVEVDAE